jgi:hypothetical protein
MSKQLNESSKEKTPPLRAAVNKPLRGNGAGSHVEARGPYRTLITNNDHECVDEMTDDG